MISKKPLKAPKTKPQILSKIKTPFTSNFGDNQVDIIVDNNIKSYSCCNISYKYFIENLFKMLNHKGILITS